ncbi:MAG: glycoside hydrolase family 172 protein [Phycisphaerales bacterium JB039]
MTASPLPGLSDIARITAARTRSISAENPTGAVAGGAQAAPGDDEHCTPAAADLGRGWKVRPCLRNFEPGRTFVLADIEGPGVIQHIWITVLRSVHRWIRLEVFYDGAEEPSICTPLGDFFANGIDGRALIASQPIAVNPMGGMNSYWPMPFRKRMRIQVTNDGPETISEFFFQITWAEQDVADDAGYLHAHWRRSTTTRDNPEHIILDGVRGRGHYAGTYLVWNQLSSMWWGEGEVKFFIDGDPADSPTICGTGTEDYFGGAWGFVMDHERDMRPTTYTTAYLGYPQAVYEADLKLGPRPPAHGLYRWHLPDPIRFQKDLRVTVQALGWWPNKKYQPLADDIASVAYWYQQTPAAVGGIGPVEGRFAR